MKKWKEEEKIIFFSVVLNISHCLACQRAIVRLHCIIGEAMGVHRRPMSFRSLALLTGLATAFVGRAKCNPYFR